MEASEQFKKLWETAKYRVYDVDTTGCGYWSQQLIPEIVFHLDRHFFYFYRDDVGGGYYNETDLAHAHEAGLRHFLDPSYERLYFEKSDTELATLSQIFSRIESTQLEIIPKDELKDLLRKTTDAASRIMGYFLMCQPQCVAAIEEKIQAELALCVPEGSVRNVYTLLCSSTEISTLRREELDWLEMMSNPDSTDEQIEMHWKKYGLWNASDGRSPTPLSEYRDRFAHDHLRKREDVRQEIDRIHADLTALAENKQRVISEYNVPAAVVAHCDLLGRIGHNRLRMRVEGWIPALYYCHMLLEEAGRRLGYGPEHLQFANQKEVFNSFDGAPINAEEIDRRKRAFLYELLDGEYRLYSGEDAIARFEALIPKRSGDKITEIRGATAMKGKVRGKAVVYRWGEEIDDKIALLKDGGILIAGQTRPQLMPLIRVSAAIVTDEGGITSHAAVVSRELGIPCIIGTHIGTEVIQTGDLIEVDAEAGVVRLLG